MPAQVDYPGCKVVSGRWIDTYTGTAYENPGEVSIDHLVPLKEAYRSGASSWSAATLVAFGNDVDRVEALRVIGGSGNAAKGDKDPAQWKPPLESAWPDYAKAWLVVKVAYGLTADQAEVEALKAMLNPPPPPPPPPPTANSAPTSAAPAPTVPPTTARPPATTAAPVTTRAPGSTGCTPGYSPCIPPASDVDCADGTGNGPAYVDGPVQVTGSDPYELDANDNGIGCE